MIYIDSSELRSNSNLQHHIPALYPLFGYESAYDLKKKASSNMLEAWTGADLMLTPLKVPVTDKTILRHVEKGAKLVQLKFGRDLTSSLGDRLYGSLCRMQTTGARQGQCILMFVGTLGAQQGTGLAVVNGRVRRPRRQYTSVIRCLDHWDDAGGVHKMVSRPSHLAKILKNMDEDLDLFGKRREIWPDLREEFPNDDPLSPFEYVQDWRPSLAAAVKGLGFVKVTALRDAILEYGAIDNLWSGIAWGTGSVEGMPKIPGWGSKTFEMVKHAVIGGDKNLLKNKRLVAELREVKEETDDK